jgi:hypothetical protein
MVHHTHVHVSNILQIAAQEVQSHADIFKHKIVKQQLETTDMARSIKDQFSLFNQIYKNIMKLQKRIHTTTDTHIQESLTDRYTTDCQQIVNRIQKFIENYKNTVCSANDILINDWMKQRPHRPKQMLPPVADLCDNLFFGRTLQNGKRVAIRANNEMQLFIYGIWIFDSYALATEVDLFDSPIPYTEDTFQSLNVTNNECVSDGSIEIEMTDTSDGDACERVRPSPRKRLKTKHDTEMHRLPITIQPSDITDDTVTAMEVDVPSIGHTINRPQACAVQAEPLHQNHNVPIDGPTVVPATQTHTETFTPNTSTQAYNSDKRVKRIYQQIRKYIEDIDSLPSDDKAFDTYPKLLECPIYWKPDAKVSITNFQNVKKNKWFYEHMKTQEFTLHQCIEHIARCAEHDMKVGNRTTYTSFMWFKNMLGAERVNKSSRRMYW